MTLTEQLQQFKEATMTRLPQSIIQTFEESLEEIAQHQLKEKALPVGAQLPDFSLTDSQENVLHLDQVHTNDFLVLNFYRGGWCPYCNLELRAYEQLKNEFTALGATIVGISAEVPELAAQTIQKNNLSFPVLTDRNAVFMKKLGLVFPLNANMKRDYAGFGMDFTSIHGNTNYELPVPAVYIINKNREIIFVHFEADYMTRIEPQQILTILKKH
ncbi:MAG: peroxiredoxin-like family protein [Aureispira sp.]